MMNKEVVASEQGDVTVPDDFERTFHLSLRHFERYFASEAETSTREDLISRPIVEALACIPSLRRSVNPAILKSIWEKLPVELREDPSSVYYHCARTISQLPTVKVVVEIEEEETVLVDEADKDNAKVGVKKDGEKKEVVNNEGKNKENKPVVELLCDADLVDLFRRDGPVALYMSTLFMIFLLDIYHQRHFTNREPMAWSEGHAACLEFYLNGIRRFVTPLISSTLGKLDPLVGRGVYWSVLAAETLDVRDEPFLGLLQDLYSVTSINKYELSQAIILNAILRSLIANQEWHRADAAASKCRFPEGATRTNQHSRYKMYKAKIEAVNNLDYASSKELLNDALRKTPQGSMGRGIRLEILRFSVVIDLLSGMIPRCNLFFDNDCAEDLKMYYDITNAVRLGSLKMFHQTIANHEQELTTHSTWPLISRLETSVVRTGLIRLCQTYRRIHMSDVQKKLGLENLRETYNVVGTAISDGVLKNVKVDAVNDILEPNGSEEKLDSEKYISICNKRIKDIRRFQNEITEATFIPEAKSDDGDEKAREVEKARKAAMEAAMKSECMYYDDEGFDDL